jgi:hypothetical protein
MLSLLSTTLSFLMGGLPKLFDFFQDRADKSHELDLARMQVEREMQMLERGYAAQARIEEIRTDQVEMQTNAQVMTAIYDHDKSLNEGTSQWVKNLRASVRPIVTYLFVAELFLINFVSLGWAIYTGVDFVTALDQVFTTEEMQIVSSIIAFWFGTQAFAKK